MWLCYVPCDGDGGDGGCEDCWGDGSDKSQGGGHDGTTRSKRVWAQRGVGEGDGWLTKEEMGRVSERPEKVSG